MDIHGRPLTPEPPHGASAQANDIATPPSRPPPPPIDTSSSSSPNGQITPAAQRILSSPVRYAATTNAFGLATSPTSTNGPSISSRDFGNVALSLNGDKSPPSAGSVAARKLRRPSLLSLTRIKSFGSDASDLGGRDDRGGIKSAVPTSTIDLLSPTTPVPPVQDPSSSKAPIEAAQAQTQVQADAVAHRSRSNPFGNNAFTPRGPSWASTHPFLTSIQRTSSAPPTAFSTLRPGSPTDLIRSARPSSPFMKLEEGDLTPHASTSPLNLMHGHFGSSFSKGKEKMDDQEMQSPEKKSSFDIPPFTGRPLPAPLLATLISESSPLEHEMRSEARLQRLIASHPQTLPMTPRPSRSSRGRFPESIDDDDDEHSMSFRGPSFRRSSMLTARGVSSDSDSDDMTLEDGQPEPVNTAFAAGMDMDRPGSSGSSASIMLLTGGHQCGNGSAGSGSTPQAQPTPPSQNGPWARSARMALGSSGSGMVPSPGAPTGLPYAFNDLGMEGSTPQASPTAERIELAGSPGSMSVSSPNLMNYRESSGGSASVRLGKRKTNNDDRYDPYKRPRGSSPGLLTNTTGFPNSPSRSTTITQNPASPGHTPYQSSGLSNNPKGINIPNRQRPAHPHKRSMNRSRAVSPALSIGSTSGVLSTSLGERGGTVNGRPSFSLGQAFVPTGAGLTSPALEGSAPQGLGGLGLLTLNGGSNHTSNQTSRRSSGEDGWMEAVREISEGIEDREEEMEQD